MTTQRTHNPTFIAVRSYHNGKSQQFILQYHKIVDLHYCEESKITIRTTYNDERNEIIVNTQFSFKKFLKSLEIEKHGIVKLKNTYAVNMQHISEVEPYKVLFADGRESCIISRTANIYLLRCMKKTFGFIG